MLLKNTFRKIKKSFGRYLSLLIIILLGVGFYTGVKESIPNIQDVQKKYYDETSLADLKIISSLGLDDEDIKALELTGVKKSIGSYSKDVLVGENAIRLHSIEEKINLVDLISGQMPKNSNECLADDSKYKIGDEIKINDDYKENLKATTYKVVGTIRSPIYSSVVYPTTEIGNGKIYSFIYLPKAVFDYEYYTEAYLVIDKKASDIPYTEGYNLKVNKIIDQLQVTKNERLTIREHEIIQASNGQLSEKDILDEWYFFKRDDFVTSYTILEDQYHQVNIIANVIPFFFILIVILMTSNTMTRMITEERGEMGTLLSLGFSNEEIIGSYLFYVLTATILGAISGYFLGTIILPKIVYACFPLNFPSAVYTFRPKLFIASTLVAIIIMLYVTISSCSKELKSSPASLLRPVAPKSGKKVFLEKISYIWNKLSFSSKITIRNIARYKKRVIMTLIGSAGCTFMIMIGFGLRDSINTVGDIQYEKLFKYDSQIILKKNIEKLDEDLTKELNKLVKTHLLINQSSFKVVDTENKLDVYLISPAEAGKNFAEYYTLRDKKTKEQIELLDDGVVITPKLKDRFNINIGDEITIEDHNQKKYQVKVAAVTENYVSNYIYISKKYYEKVFNESPKYNTIVTKNKKTNDAVAKTLLKTDKILNITFAKDLRKDANSSIRGLNSVIIILVTISSLLVFTILYNLTSINISERTREIATLKVLGFRDRESNEYIYRETLITVLVGIILGLAITPPLHNIVMSLLEVDHMVFLRKINLTSYIYSSILTLIFALIMQAVTFYKMKKVNMIESLKSVE